MDEGGSDGGSESNPDKDGGEYIDEVGFGRGGVEWSVQSEGPSRMEVRGKIERRSMK